MFGHGDPRASYRIRSRSSAALGEATARRAPNDRKVRDRCASNSIRQLSYSCLCRVETVETLQQHYILTPSHVRESYLYYLLLHPPESTIHLRRALPEPVKHSRKKQKTPTRPSAKAKKKPSDEEEIEQPPPTIIFCTKPRTAAYLTNLLKTLHIRTTALHSRLTQRERLSSLGLFRSSVIPVLVSTDVGARGLDIEDVALVINWDLPSEPEEYTHRVGRTARKGKGGVAVSFVTEWDEEKVLKIEGRISESIILERRSIEIKRWGIHRDPD